MSEKKGQRTDFTKVLCDPKRIYKLVNFIKDVMFAQKGKIPTKSTNNHIFAVVNQG